jgi:adenylate kinase family enzyme
MYKKVIIIGGGGAGKSTLADRIGTYTGYPVYHLDNLLLDSNWVMKDKSKWEEISQIFLTKDSGIVDGNYSSSMPNRVKWAQVIIYIDISTHVQLWRIVSRYVKNKLGLDKRYGFPDGSKEKMDMKFILWTYHWNSNHREKLLSMLGLEKDKKVLIIKEARSLDIKSLFE